MVKIRLSRTGRKNLPSYRIVVVPAREKRETKSLEIVGTYFPLKKEVNLNVDRIKYWLSVGAQPTETVENFLVKQEILPKPEHKRKFAKTPGKKAKSRTEEKK